MGRRKSRFWDHFEEAPGVVGNKLQRVQCKYCQETVSSSVTRVKSHLSHCEAAKNLDWDDCMMKEYTSGKTSLHHALSNNSNELRSAFASVPGSASTSGSSNSNSSSSSVQQQFQQFQQQVQQQFLSLHQEISNLSNQVIQLRITTSRARNGAMKSNSQDIEPLCNSNGQCPSDQNLVFPRTIDEFFKIEDHDSVNSLLLFYGLPIVPNQQLKDKVNMLLHHLGVSVDNISMV